MPLLAALETDQCLALGALQLVCFIEASASHDAITARLDAVANQRVSIKSLLLLEA